MDKYACLLHTTYPSWLLQPISWLKSLVKLQSRPAGHEGGSDHTLTFTWGHSFHVLFFPARVATVSVINLALTPAFRCISARYIYNLDCFSDLMSFWRNGSLHRLSIKLKYSA